MDKERESQIRRPQSGGVVAQKAEFLPFDIYEDILLRLDLKSLGRYKSVSKSWKSHISGPRFIKTHLDLSNNRNEKGHKRIGEAVFVFAFRHFKPHFIGSSNGLVCVTDKDELLVANPYTREVKTLQYPRGIDFESSCWGFGYDSDTGDYKVVLGVVEGKDQTRFLVKSLKSDAWKVIGQVDYICARNQFVGALCNGAVHWVMRPKKNIKNEVILSFDLSKEKFKEIPQPDGTAGSSLFLGLMEEFLCLMWEREKLWVMKKYNVKESWEVADEYTYKAEYADDFDETENDDYIWFIGSRKFVNCPVIVESLVSPHLQA